MRTPSLRLAALLSLSAFAIVGCGSDAIEDESEAGADSALTGSTANDRTAFTYFVNKGLTKTQSAAIVGNLDQESGMNPKAKQLPSGPGRGIAQWSVNDRWKTLNVFAHSEGRDPLALETQLAFVWHELTTNPAYGLAALKRATALASAVEVFQDKYEICGHCNVGSRITFAKNALDAFGKIADEDPAGDCIVDGSFGTCISTNACAQQGGASTAGLCPGGANIQCCTH